MAYTFSFVSIIFYVSLLVNLQPIFCLHGPGEWRFLGDLDCGFSGRSASSTLANQYDSDAFRTFVSKKSIMTFSTCDSADEFNTVLTLWSSDDETSAIEIDDCDNSFIGGCAKCVSNSLSAHQTWNIELDVGFYWIEVWAISSLAGDYKLDVSCTPSPTTSTTQQPTDDPTTLQPTTKQPSSDPTDAPTTEPTTEPTNIPSSDPTSDPTVDPSSDPTSDPTVPTQYPSLFPTKLPTQKPSFSPTFFPTLMDNNGEAENGIATTMTNTKENKLLSEESGMDLVTILIIIICLLVAVILIGAIGCYFCFVSKKHKQSNVVSHQKAQEMIEFGHVAPSNGITNTGSNVNPAIMRVVSLSASGDGIMRTGSGETNMSTNGDGNDSEEDNGGMYDDEQRKIKQTPSMSPMMHDSPGTKSFVVTPESKPLTTPGNVSVDFMDINEDMRQVTPGIDEENETEILKEMVENESDDDDDDDAEDMMYGKDNKHRTSGK